MISIGLLEGVSLLWAALLKGSFHSEEAILVGFLTVCIPRVCARVCIVLGSFSVIIYIIFLKWTHNSPTKLDRLADQEAPGTHLPHVSCIKITALATMSFMWVLGTTCLCSKHFID